MHSNPKMEDFKQPLKNKEEEILTANPEKTATLMDTTEEQTKNNEVETELQAAQKEVRDQQDRYLRLYAEFENHRKRVAKERADAIQTATMDVVQEFLPVMDALDQAFTHSQADTSLATLLQGIEMVRKQFQTTLLKFGIAAFESLGAEFDPNWHEAVSQQESAEYPSHSVVVEYRKGYKMNDKLLRPAMVAVSKPVSETNSHSRTEDKENS